ncbi:sensor histidine kinase [Streptomyces sp. NPDC054796]
MTETGDSRAACGPWWWSRRRAAVLDIVLAAISAVECGVQGARFAGEAGIPAWAGVLLGVAAGGSLVARRRWPVAVVLVAIAVTPAEMGFLLGCVGLYSLAASDVPRRIIALLTAMQAVGGLIIILVRVHQSIGQEPDFNPPTWFIPAISVLVALGLTAPPLLLGLYVGARRRLVESLRERADGLERELALLADRAEERAEWARNEERTRIAREMHDVVAHRVSLMVVHAAALQAIAVKDPEKASRNAGLVGDMGRQALTELRTMLGVLRSEVAEARPSGSGSGQERVRVRSSSPSPARSSSAGTPQAPASSQGRAAGRGAGSADGSGSGSANGDGDGSGDGGAPVRLAEFAAVVAGAAVGRGAARDGGFGDPDGGDGGGEGDGKGKANGNGGPSLGELDVLVGQSREAGMAVELSVEGAPRDYAPQVEQTAFRVVQEALTNVHKHAAGARARVRLAHREAEVAVQVENEPPAEGDGSADAGLPSGGNGLVGMRERVTALGGGFVSGPTDAGGFRVSAVIPDGGHL